MIRQKKGKGYPGARDKNICICACVQQRTYDLWVYIYKHTSIEKAASFLIDIGWRASARASFYNTILVTLTGLALVIGRCVRKAIAWWWSGTWSYWLFLIARTLSCSTRRGRKKLSALEMKFQILWRLLEDFFFFCDLLYLENYVLYCNILRKNRLFTW